MSTTAIAISISSVIVGIILFLVWIWGSQKNESGPYRHDRVAARAKNAQKRTKPPAASAMRSLEDTESRDVADVEAVAADTQPEPASDPPSTEPEITVAPANGADAAITAGSISSANQKTDPALTNANMAVELAPSAAKEASLISSSITELENSVSPESFRGKNAGSGTTGKNRNRSKRPSHDPRVRRSQSRDRAREQRRAERRSRSRQERSIQEE